MPQIRPITDLRNTTEISEFCHASREPLFITKNGYGDLVVMSIETYEEMMETARAGAAISDAGQEYAADGVLLNARKVLSSLRFSVVGIWVILCDFRGFFGAFFFDMQLVSEVFEIFVIMVLSQNSF